MDGTIKRFPILVYVGKTQTAKTLRARDFWGASKTVVVGCKNSLFPNLSGFKNQSCILWDEASHEFVLANRGLLQSGVEGCQIYSSPTQVSARWVFLYGVAQIVTTNFWPEEDLTTTDGEWLAGNCLVRQITEPLYMTE